MNACNHIKELNEWQVAQLREHLSKHRYYLGEQGVQLNDNELEIDFVLKYMDEVAQTLRIEYCTNICPCRHNCELGHFLCEKSLDT